MNASPAADAPGVSPIAEDAERDEILAEILALEVEEQPTLEELEEAQRMRRRIAIEVVGDLTPEWFIEAVCVNGADYLETERGSLLVDALRVSFEDRNAVVIRLARHLLGCGVHRLVVLAVLSGWAQYHAAPVPFEGELVDLVRLATESADQVPT